MKTHDENQQPSRSPNAWLALATLLLGLHACGGSGGVDSGGTGMDTPTLAVGPISGFGSIVVAGVHYDETSARIVDGDGQPLTAAALMLGAMTRIDASQVTAAGTRLQATAQLIRVAEVLLGPVEAVDSVAMTARVLGQIVAITPGTVFEAALGGGLPALSSGMVVAVHGQIDPVATRVVATRIERRSSVERNLLRGPVTSLDRVALRLNIGATAVSLAEAGSLPAALGTGSVVRLKLRTVAVAGVWIATELSLDDQPLPDRENVEIQGRVTALTSMQRFSVDGSAVDASTAIFSGGAVVLGARVEVEGRSSAGSVVARKVAVDAGEGGGDEALEIEGQITVLDTTARTFVVRGTTVSYAGTPRFEGGTAADLALNRKVHVKGRLADDRSLVMATSIQVEL